MNNVYNLIEKCPNGICLGLSSWKANCYQTINGGRVTNESDLLDMRQPDNIRRILEQELWGVSDEQ
jgi:hypothetical protein